MNSHPPLRFFPDQRPRVPKPYTLPDVVRAQIELAIQARPQATKPPEEFWAAVAMAITLYRLDRDGASLSRKPAQMRATLAGTRKTALKLQAQLLEISRYNFPTAKGKRRDIRDFATTPLTDLLAVLESIEAESQQLPNGRLPDYALQVLTATLAHLMRTRIKVEPTTTTNGLFAELIGLVLAEAAKNLNLEPVEVSRKMLTTAIKARVEESTTSDSAPLFRFGFV